MRTIGCFSLAVLVGAGTASAQIQRSNPPGLSTPSNYSHVVKAGGIVYIAGQVASDAQGKVVGPGMLEQVEQVLKNLEIALRSQKLDFSHVVKINTYVTDMDAFRASDVAAVRAKYFGTNRPASTLVGVTRLASPDYKVEIEAIAHVPPGILRVQQ